MMFAVICFLHELLGDPVHDRILGLGMSAGLLQVLQGLLRPLELAQGLAQVEVRDGQQPVAGAASQDSSRQLLGLCIPVRPAQLRELRGPALGRGRVLRLPGLQKGLDRHAEAVRDVSQTVHRWP